MTAQSAIIEAEGMAIIQDNDISSAREYAIKDASQQASMQAAVYISSNQVVKDGILAIDNMQINTLGQVSNIQVLDEKIIDNRLHVKIRAEVFIDEGCKNGVINKYTKSVAFTAFPVANIRQVNLGGLQNISSALPRKLSQLARNEKDLISLDASHLDLRQPSGSLPNQLDDRALYTLETTLNGIGTNYIAAGIIQDLSMVDPRTHAENNFYIDLYNRLDYRSKKHLRNFQLSLNVYDAFTGHLVTQKQYQTTGLWNLDRTIKTGFDSAGFLKQDYGQKVTQLQQHLIKDLSNQLSCEPFTARITRTQDKRLWIAAGKHQGIKRGDKLAVYRKSTHYNHDMRPATDINSTQQTLIIDDVQMHSASGHLPLAAESFNIRPGDLVIAR